jgi:Cytochrome c oxidase subunit IV
MTTALAVFLSSAAFGVAIAVVYWFSSHHRGGTLLLGLMAVAMTFTAAFTYAAGRNADLSGDRDPAGNQSPREDLGIFTTRSIWPPAAAAATCVLFIGIVWSPYVAAAGLIGLLLVLWRLGAESNRT